MDLFTSFFSPRVTEQQSGKREVEVAFLMGIGNFGLEITGVASHQTALEAIGGPREPNGVKRFETAWLILEDKNSQNENAVRVEIQGKPVGYLSPEDAMRYRQQLLARDKPNAKGQCQAVIKGGRLSSDGRKGIYEVWLDFPILYQ